MERKRRGSKESRRARGREGKGLERRRRGRNVEGEERGGGYFLLRM